MAGTIKFLAPPDVPVKFNRIFLADCAVLASVNVSVTSELEKDTSTVPAIDSSSAVPKFTLVTSPQVPALSPVPMSCNLRFDEYVDAIFYS